MSTLFKDAEQFFVFGGSYYYPRGGLDDLITSFSSIGECLQFVTNPMIDPLWSELNLSGGVLEWWQVYDSETREVVIDSEIPSGPRLWDIYKAHQQKETR